MKICQISDQDVVKLINSEIKLHPLLEPVDLYKLLYQAFYGPFHIVRDFKQLCLSIYKELWLMDRGYIPTFQRIGPCYARISLSVVKRDKDQDLTKARVESLGRWILDSCVLFEDVTDDFRSRWHKYGECMRKALVSSPKAWKLADDLAETGELPSHSEIFHERYNPHYRLVNIKLHDHYTRFMELNK